MAKNTNVSMLGSAARTGDFAKLTALISEGCPVDNFEGKGRHTPLMRAARNGHASCVRALAPLCRVDARNKKGETALYLAARGGHLKCVEILIETCDPKQYWKTRPTPPKTFAPVAAPDLALDPVFACVPKFQWDCFHALLRIVPPGWVGRDDLSALFIAAGWCAPTEIIQQLATESEARGQFKDERTALMEAAQFGFAVGPLDLLDLNHVAARNVQALVGLSDLEARCIAGNTALHCVADADRLFESPTIIGILLGAGADPAARNNAGETPLMLAAKAGLQNTVKLLLTVSDPLAVNNDGKTLMEFALESRNKETLELIRHAMAMAEAAEISKCLAAPKINNARSARL